MSFLKKVISVYRCYIVNSNFNFVDNSREHRIKSVLLQLVCWIFNKNKIADFLLDVNKIFHYTCTIHISNIVICYYKEDYFLIQSLDQSCDMFLIKKLRLAYYILHVVVRQSPCTLVIQQTNNFYSCFIVCTCILFH